MIMAEQLNDPGFLRKIPIFDSLSDEALMGIIKSPDNSIEEYAQKEVIIKESEIGECMYIILEGTVEVSIRGGSSNREITVATLRPGDFFGEQALSVTDRTGRRNATVRAYFPSKLFRIDKKHVHIGLEKGFKGSDDITVPATVTSYLDKEVQGLLKEMRLFRSLGEEELSSVGNWTDTLTVGPGEFVLKESELGDCLYVVLEGTVEIFTLDDDGKIVILAKHTRGNYFGEQALMPGSSGERNAYARSDEKVKLIRVKKSYFRLLLNRDSELLQALQKIGAAQKQEIDQIQK